MAKRQYQTIPLDQRLYRGCKYNEKTDCWEWQRAKNNIGYGMIRDNEIQGMRTTHRASYEIHKGTIPKNKIVMHTCDNRACCNPKHLFLGTHKQNTQDMQEKGRDNHFGTKLKVKCKYCDMVTRPTLIKRWHDDNCKHKPKP